MGRKKTPDILGGILGEPEGGRREAKKRKPPPLEKTKATYYLAPRTVEALEAGWLKLRQMSRGGRTKVSKSAIVDAALRLALAELSEQEEESQLAVMLVDR